jgi:transposase
VGTWSLAPQVRALQCLRRVSLVVASTVVAEIGSLRRVDHPKELMAYIGVVPSEDSTGARVRRGPITRTGNGHVRRMLIEASWAYRSLVAFALQERVASLFRTEAAASGT